MKVFITLAVVCLIATALATPLALDEAQRDKAKEYFEECIKQENVTKDEVIKLRNKNFANPSKNLKCFGTCFFEKVGTLKDNVVQEEIIMTKLGSVLGEQRTKTILENCKDVKGDDRCDTGFKIYACFESSKAELTTG